MNTGDGTNATSTSGWENILSNSSNSSNDIFNCLYLNVIFSWNNIKQNSQIMNCLNMQENNLCRYYKSADPHVRDSFIQARVFTLTLIVILSLIFPINIDNEQINEHFLLYESNNNTSSTLLHNAIYDVD